MEDETGKYGIVTVGGGCNLGIDVSDPLSTKANSLDYQLNDRKYGLPLLGGMSH